MGNIWTMCSQGTKTVCTFFGVQSLNFLLDIINQLSFEYDRIVKFCFLNLKHTGDNSQTIARLDITCLLVC